MGKAIPYETVKALVVDRCTTSKAGYDMQKLNKLFSGDDFKSAPLQNPPLATGMTDSVQKLKAIIMKPTDVTPDEYRQVCIMSIQ